MPVNKYLEQGKHLQKAMEREGKRQPELAKLLAEKKFSLSPDKASSEASLQKTLSKYINGDIKHPNIQLIQLLEELLNEPKLFDLYFPKQPRTNDSKEDGGGLQDPNINYSNTNTTSGGQQRDSSKAITKEFLEEKLKEQSQSNEITLYDEFTLKIIGNTLSNAFLEEKLGTLSKNIQDKVMYCRLYAKEYYMQRLSEPEG